MAVNKHAQHILVLPEDDHNRELANGFVLCLDSVRARRIQVLQVAGGWLKVLETFQLDHIADMDQYPSRFMILVIDFDNDERRLAGALSRIPDRLRDRVFIVGSAKEPQDLVNARLWQHPAALLAGLGSKLEQIGYALGHDCRENTATTWGHPLLLANTPELERLREIVRPIIF